MTLLKKLARTFSRKRSHFFSRTSIMLEPEQEPVAEHEQATRLYKACKSLLEAYEHVAQ